MLPTKIKEIKIVPKIAKYFFIFFPPKFRNFSKMNYYLRAQISQDKNFLTVDQFLNSSLIKAGGGEALPLPPVSCWREILKLLNGQKNFGGQLTPLGQLKCWGK